MATTGDYPAANGNSSGHPDTSLEKVQTTKKFADEVDSAPAYPTNPKYPNNSAASIQDVHRLGKVASTESQGSQDTSSMGVNGRPSENSFCPPMNLSNDSNYVVWSGLRFSQSPSDSDEGIRRIDHHNSMSDKPPTSPVKGPTPPFDDPESPRHVAELEKRKRLSYIRKIVVAASTLAGSMAFIVMVALLSCSKSKKMARASFTGGVTIIWLSIAAGMAAADRGMVEVLIMMNIVMVYGIFLSGQIDILMS